MSARVWSALEIHKIAYLTSKGWFPDESSPSDDRLHWHFTSATDPDLDTWCISLDDAYASQLARDVAEKEEKKDA